MFASIYDPEITARAKQRVFLSAATAVLWAIIGAFYAADMVSELIISASGVVFCLAAAVVSWGASLKAHAHCRKIISMDELPSTIKQIAAHDVMYENNDKIQNKIARWMLIDHHAHLFMNCVAVLHVFLFIVIHCSKHNR